MSKKLLSVSDIYPLDGKSSFSDTAIPSPVWFDNFHYLYRTDEKEANFLKVHVETGDSEVFYDTDRFYHSLKSYLNTDSETAKGLAQRKTHLLSPDKRHLLIDHGSDLLYYEIKDSSFSILVEGRDKKVAPEFSPNGRFVSYIKENNISIVDTKTLCDKTLTKEATTTTLIGHLDWVYQEEVYGRGNYKAYWWSPDSQKIVFLALDVTNVNTVVLANYLSDVNPIETLQYPRAGEANPQAKIGLVTIKGEPIKWIDTSPYEKIDHLIVRVAWTPDNCNVVYQVQNRQQTWLDLNCFDVKSFRQKTVLREDSGPWVKALDNPHWMKDGSFFWLSERSGWKHIYHYNDQHQLIKQITDGSWEVREFGGIDEENDAIYFTANEHSYICNDIYRVSLGGGNPTRLTENNGTHKAVWSPTFDYFLDYCSSVNSPTEVSLNKSTGVLVRKIHEGNNQILKEYEIGETKFFRISTRDGFPMEGMMIRPPEFDDSKKYPVLVYVYGGPSSPTVADGWGGALFMWHQMLAQKGYIIWMCDNRSASGKGAISAWPVHRNIGRVALEDLIDGLTWLKDKAYVDPSRIGIWGWSFGGTLTINAMTRTEEFRIGIAGAPVTDWRLYDTIYTERYMDIPARNVEGYKETCAVTKAGSLYGRLLLVHGMMDENVHIKNSIDLIRALQKAGKQFDLMLYPGANHSVEDSRDLHHLRSLMTEFILEKL